MCAINDAIDTFRLFVFNLFSGIFVSLCIFLCLMISVVFSLIFNFVLHVEPFLEFLAHY